jgi:hypothetical protein
VNDVSAIAPAIASDQREERTYEVLLSGVLPRPGSAPEFMQCYRQNEGDQEEADQRD